jgi:translation initiation factor 1
MCAQKNGKISTLGSSSLEVNPFAQLNVEGLPAGQVQSQQSSRQQRAAKKSKGRVEVRREKAGRGGKTVTTLKAFPSHIPLVTLEAITFELKKICACGGTLKGRVVELQGDVCDRVCEELKKRGYQAVRAGG